MEPRHNGAALPVVLTIAGFDPTGGAGVAADLKTLAAQNCYGVAAITALTLQNTEGVKSVQCVNASFLAEEIEALASDMPLAAVKIGMLGSAPNVEVVAAALEKHTPPFTVLDPVFRSTSGATLLEDKGIKVLCEKVLPRVNLVTPNLDEAARLTGLSVTNLDEMKIAAAAIHKACGAQVVVTGGHLDKPQDVFFDGTNFTVFAGDRVRSQNTHGTGCAFSAAIAANVALGKSIADAIVLAKAYVTQAIEKGYGLGKGRGLLNHLYRLNSTTPPRAVPAEPAEAHAGGHR